MYNYTQIDIFTGITAGELVNFDKHGKGCCFRGKGWYNELGGIQLYINHCTEARRLCAFS